MLNWIRFEIAGYFSNTLLVFELVGILFYFICISAKSRSIITDIFCGIILT